MYVCTSTHKYVHTHACLCTRAEVKAEIKKHSQELNALYDALPSGMAIGGLVYVNTQKVG